MKYYSLLLLALSLPLMGEVIEVKKLKQDRDLERSFVLQTNLPDRVVLDCQSFIQGLRIGEAESAITYMMDPWECGELQKRVKNSVQRFKKHCIDVEEDIRTDYTCQ